jgi:hypothetical protein
VNFRHIDKRLACQAGHAAAWLAPGIPYRTDAPVSMGTFAMALLVTLVLLALLVVALIFIRRRGWLPRAGQAHSASAQEGIQLQASRRLSMASTAHVVSYRGQTFFVVESGRGTNVAVTPMRLDGGQDEVRP